MSNKREIFTKVTTNVGVEYSIYEIKGKEYFNALLKSNGQTPIILKYLMMESVCVDGKLLTEEEIDEISANDLVSISEAMGLMFQNKKFF